MSQVAKADRDQAQRRNLFARITLFIKQVIDELRKVVWPTRNSLWSYFLVVLVFITAIMVFVALIDTVFEQLVMWVFA